MRNVFLGALVYCVLGSASYLVAEELTDSDSETNMVICLEKALAGDPQFEYLAGKSYMYGLGVERNPEQAFCWASRSAEHGNVNGVNLLGVCYQDGIGCVGNEGKAEELFKRAAAGGSIKAKGNLGYMYVTGWGRDEKEKEATRNINKAVPLLKECLGSGLEHVNAMCALVGCYEKIDAEKYSGEMFKWAQKAANLGSRWARFKMAEFSLLGIGCDQNEGECLSWIKKAMEGFSICGIQLGLCSADADAIRGRAGKVEGVGYDSSDFRPPRQFRLFEGMGFYRTFESRANVIWRIELSTHRLFRDASTDVQDKEEQMVLDLLEKKYKGRFDTRAGDRHIMKIGVVEIEVRRWRGDQLIIRFGSEHLNSFVRHLNYMFEKNEQRKKDRNSGAVLEASDGADVL